MLRTAVIVLVGGVQAFWQSQRDGIEPPPDFARDGAAIEQFRKRMPVIDVLDLNGNGYFRKLAKECLAATVQRNRLNDELDALHAEIGHLEEKNLFASLRPDFHPFIRFCLITGARVTSARTLTWSDVDLAAGEIRLNVKSKVSGERHTLPITPELAALLTSVKGHHPIFVFTYLCESVEVKGRRAGERYPFSAHGWRRTWMSALRRAGIADFRFHDLRHTAATQMLRASGNIAGVSAVLGHSDIKMTMRYAHVMKDDLRVILSRNPQNIPRLNDKEKEENQLSI